MTAVLKLTKTRCCYKADQTKTSEFALAFVKAGVEHADALSGTFVMAQDIKQVVLDKTVLAGRQAGATWNASET